MQVWLVWRWLSLTLFHGFSKSKKVNWFSIQYWYHVRQLIILKIFFYFTRESKTITHNTTKLQNCKLQLFQVASDLTDRKPWLWVKYYIHYKLKEQNYTIVILRLKGWVLSQSVLRFLTSFLLFCVIINLRVVFQTKERILCYVLSFLL